VVESYSFFW